MKSIYRYIQLGVYIRGYQDKTTKRFVREIGEVTEFYVDKDNNAVYNTIYRKTTTGKVYRKEPSDYLIDYLDAQGVTLPKDIIKVDENDSDESENSVPPIGPKIPVTPVVTPVNIPTSNVGSNVGVTPVAPTQAEILFE